MKKNTKNIIFFTSGLFVMVAVLIVFNLYNKGPLNVAKGKPIKTTPELLYSSYLTDSVTAHDTYSGKIVLLTGQVTGITENIQKQQVLLIKTSASGGFINCTMEQSAPGVIAGGMVTVRGICSGMGEGDADLGISGDVYLIRTVLAN